MTRLSVNLNKVALLRNSRSLGIPDLSAAARIVIRAGADGITVHPRPDGRHIRPRDVGNLAQLLAEEGTLRGRVGSKSGNYSDGRNGDRESGQSGNKSDPKTDPTVVEYNIEGNPFMEGFLNLVTAVGPTQCTLVPDSAEQSTSDHGWDLRGNGAQLGPIIHQLQEQNIRVSLFMDPDQEMIQRIAELHPDRIELYTFSYNQAYGTKDEEAVLEQFRLAAETAQEAGIGINAGHDLNLRNLPRFLKHIPGVLEVSIGHALIADALFLGLEQAIEAYLTAILSSSSPSLSSSSSSSAAKSATAAFRQQTIETPLLCADAIIEIGEQIVMIKRKNRPYGFALPGGFVEQGESTEAAAIREAYEETGLKIELRDLLGIYSDPQRDPRQHTASVVYIATAKGIPQAADDAEESFLCRAEEPPSPVVFDHLSILQDYIHYKKQGKRPRLKVI